MFTNCIIKNIPLFLEQKFFHDSSHYIRIMGYDKPVDFKLNNGLNRTITVDTNYKKDKNKKYVNVLALVSTEMNCYKRSSLMKRNL